MRLFITQTARHARNRRRIGRRALRSAQCARSRHMAAAIVFRAHSCMRRPALSQGAKAQKMSKITRLPMSSALVLSIFFIIYLFRRINMPRQYFLVIEFVYNICNYRNIRKRRFPL